MSSSFRPVVSIKSKYTVRSCNELAGKRKSNWFDIRSSNKLRLFSFKANKKTEHIRPNSKWLLCPALARWRIPLKRFQSIPLLGMSKRRHSGECDPNSRAQQMPVVWQTVCPRNECLVCMFRWLCHNRHKTPTKFRFMKMRFVCLFFRLSFQSFHLHCVIVNIDNFSTMPLRLVQCGANQTNFQILIRNRCLCHHGLGALVFMVKKTWKTNAKWKQNIPNQIAQFEWNVLATYSRRSMSESIASECSFSWNQNLNGLCTCDRNKRNPWPGWMSLSNSMDGKSPTWILSSLNVIR